MGEHEWIQTKKECEVDAQGNLVPRMITLERSRKKYLGFEKKDAVDILLRVASFFAVFIPLGLFYLQRKAEINKQKAIYQLQVYAEATSLLHQILEMPADSANFSSATNKLYFDSYPKLRILGENEVSNKFREIKNQIPLYSFLYKVDDHLSNFYQNASHLLDGMLYIDDTHTGDDKKTIERFFQEKRVTDSSYVAFASLQQALRQNFVSKEPADTNGLNAIQQFAKREKIQVDKMEEYHAWFNNLSDRFYTDTLIRNHGYNDDYDYYYVGFAETSGAVTMKMKDMKQELTGHKDLISNFKNHLLREVEQLDSLMMVSNSHL
ncbi:MAG: hypothetical protein INR73_18695 [Williamsia sp.]|nr:hypothetical protein [Williamsia sp.]